MEEKLLEQMADILEADIAELDLETEFKDDKFDWDSLKGYAMLVMLEEEFNIEMTVEDFIETKKIKDLYDYIQKNSSI